MIAKVIKKNCKAAYIKMTILEKTDTRLRILYLLRVLKKGTDAEHILTNDVIRSIMEKEYGILIHRTNVAGDIGALRQAGFEIIGHRYRQNSYYYEGQTFEMAELKKMIDAAESSRFITEGESYRLTKKLMSLTNEARH